MLLTCFVRAFAADSYINLNGFSFDINDKGEAVIHEYTGSSADVVIPEKLLGAYVSTIDSYAFFNNTDITSVSFENATHLETIGVNAFYGCSGIKALTIPSQVDTIEFGAFQNCSGLERVMIENGVTTIEDQAFLGCAALVDAAIPESVTSIGNTAFSGCDNVVIYCDEGTYAQTYAAENTSEYVLMYCYELGDVNLDRNINIRDATLIQMFLVGLIDELPTCLGRNYADTSRDGKISIRDATLIQMKIVDLISEF